MDEDRDRFARALAEGEQARADGDHVRGADAAEAATAVAVAAGDRQGAAVAGTLWVHHLWRLGRTEQAERLAQELLPDVDRLRDRASAVDLRHTLGMVLCDLGRPADGLRHVVRALEIARTDADPDELCWSLNRLGVVYSALGDNRRAADLLRQAIEVSEGCRTAEPAFSAQFNLATMLERQAEQARDQGDADAARELAARSLDVAGEAATRAGNQPHRQMFLSLLECKNLELLGRAEEMAAAVERYQALARGLELTHFENIGELLHARWLFAAGRFQESLEWLTDRVDWSGAAYDDDVHRWLLQLQYRVNKALGRFDAALAAHEALLGLERRTALVRLEGQARVLLQEAELQAAREEADRLRRRSAELAARADAATQEAHVDALTGVANRRALDLRLLHTLGSRDGALDLAVAMVDGDHFKSINDTYGHAAGDQVLRALSRILQAGLRPGDYVARNGGEEFVVLLAGRSMSAARQTCERLRRDVADHDWTTVVPGRRVTISVGLTDVRVGDDPSTLLRRADAAMYRAKRTGRNRVVVDAGPLTRPARRP